MASYRTAIAAKSDLERQENKTKTGVFLGAYATNPVNGERVPVFIADYVLAGYGTGAIMAVPGHDQRDWEFASQFGLPIVQVISGGSVEESAYGGDGTLINSGDLDGLSIASAKEAVINRLGPTAMAGRASSTSCATGCSPGSGTGVSRSPSSTTPTAGPIRCRIRPCRLSFRTCPTMRRCSSIPTTPTASRLLRLARPPSG